MREYIGWRLCLTPVLRRYRSPLYRKYNLGTTVFSALAGGFLTGKVCRDAEFSYGPTANATS